MSDEKINILRFLKMNETLSPQMLKQQLKRNRCVACFSYERKLQALCETGVLEKLCPEFISFSRETLVCWECDSAIRNVIKFRDKVLAAQVLWKRAIEGEQIDLKGITCLGATDVSILSIVAPQSDPKEQTSQENRQWKTEQSTKTYGKVEIELQREIKIEPQDDFDVDTFETCMAKIEDCGKITVSDFKMSVQCGQGQKRTTKKNTRRKSKVSVKKSASTDATSTEQRDGKRKTKHTTKTKSESDSGTPLDNVVIRKDNLKERRVDNKVLLVHDDRDVCTVETMSERQMVKYREAKRNEGIYRNSELKCESCVRRFVSRSSYVDHLATHEEVCGKLVCTICAQRFSTEQALADHNTTHYKMYKCAKCEYESVPLELMMRHYQRNHLGARRLCRDCDLVFRSDKAYGRHRHQVHKERVQCTVCGNDFHDLNTLELHMIRRHKSKLKGLECTFCHKMLKGPNCLRLHVKRMHEQVREKETFCVECNTQFKNAASLRSHYRFSSKHNSRDNMKHQCLECGKRFYQSAALRRHREGAHLKLRAYQCHKCDQAFNTKRTLGHHVTMKHEGGEPKDKMCDYCGKAFSSKAFLKEHINTHTGARPYVCEDCGASFGSSGTLFWHRKCVHKVLSRKQRAEAERLRQEAEAKS